MKAIEAGRLRHLITIQRRTVTQDEIGGQIEVWATFATVWAEREPQKGREFIAAWNLTASRPEIFKVRYRSDLREDDRIMHGGHVFAIRSLANAGGLSAVLEIITEAGAEAR